LIPHSALRTAQSDGFPFFGFQLLFGQYLSGSGEITSEMPQKSQVTSIPHITPAGDKMETY
jgi:hypothetical protein